ncbi:glycoside hydrolase superfamily [Aspergillus pseudonomiae]|uniref:chitinase n=1 Tax=Aspergillus pseudonomiae TaxID=1506151 RepID=A0A5N7CY73_9EURO|nr:glycoside hydrolase superfamily [Aspergillus pseudonomiae]KAB8255004.1 glycoside hydrolase superfamily [Aspergillus pseudonomiae]KAE8398498.1 glycoside hydrolase superfamily [Aspergillus pseudonomiae]
MVFFQGPKRHFLSLLLACLAVQVLSLSISERKTCSGASSKQRYIGLYEPWHLDRGFGILEILDINVEPWTHLYMPDSPFGPSYTLEDTRLFKDWKDFTDLKIKKPSLKTYLSVFHFLDEDNQWPNITRSFKDRKYFIDKFVKFMEMYGFDGLNLDLSTAYIPGILWESDDLIHKIGGLRGLDLSGIADHLDHLTFFPYSVTRGCRKQEPPKAEMDTVFGIEHSLRRLREANIDPNKLSMGLDLAADTDKFEDPTCNTPGCPSVPLKGQGFSAYELERIIEREVRFRNAEALKKRADLANKHCLRGLLAYIAEGGPASLRNPNDLDPSDKNMRGAPLTNDTRYSTMATPFTPSTQSASLSTATNSDADANGNTEGLSCHPAIGSVHVPIAQLDCDSNSTSTASHNSDAPVNAEEGAPSPSPTAPHETGTPDEPSATGPKPTLTVAHRIGSPIDSTKKADDEGTTPGEPTAAP